MSTYLDFSIKTRDQFKTWIQGMMGAPLITIELTDSQLDMCIDNAVEEYTKYITQEQVYLLVPMTGYIENVGYKMPDNVQGIFEFNDDNAANLGINTLFSVGNSMLNAGLIPNFSQGGGAGWTTFELAMESVKMTKRMLGRGFGMEYNPRTKYLTVYPDPKKENIVGEIVVGCYIIRPEDQQYGEVIVKKLALAEAKILLGNVRKKFQGVSLLGGGVIDISILDEGKQEKQEILQVLVKESQACMSFFFG